MNNRSLHKFVPLFVVASGLSLAGCGSPAPPEPKSGPAVVTREEAEQVKVGMFLKEVQDIIGDPGKEMKAPPSAPAGTSMYMWSNPDASSLMVEFRGGRVFSLTPINLVQAVSEESLSKKGS